jgi:hypothetical protein
VTWRDHGWDAPRKSTCDGTVDFYLSEGFEVPATPNERLLALEPEDIHLALTL